MKTYRKILAMALRYIAFVMLTFGVYVESGANTALAIGVCFFLFELNYFYKKEINKILEEIYEWVEEIEDRIKRKGK
jgi:hypothetical protein